MTTDEHNTAGGLRAQLARVSNLDRRWIFLAMGLAVGVPILLKLRFPEVPGPLAIATFNAIEAVPEGSRVLIAFDYDPASEGELQPMANAMLHHCASRKHKMVFIALWPLGKQMADETIKNVLLAFHPQYQYGTDYVQLGYKAGNESVIKMMTTNIPQAFPSDASGKTLSELPLVADLESVQQVELIITFSAGYPGAKEWVQYAKSSYPDDFVLVAGSTGVQANQLFPYYPKQMEGMLAAIKGAAEYEMLVTAKYPVTKDKERFEEGRRRMGPQLVAHLLMIGLILLGNVAMVAGRSRQSRGGQGAVR
ncbi:MAG: hypothetical protein DWH97_00960 [Planctomycetota bacterium]|jgi:hypothetical protein|nr:MAG: hypothetical protein DWH97_00960 [Planctomycetota bacterium]RLS94196.1 MAG: hypothetical protein DWI12_07175 [Planctomycetota bacterium]